jgi:8-oxo-dGTP diphosphatase
MSIYVVRHAKAGSRASWHGDDRARPLTPAGQAQARHLVERFVGIDVPKVISSPYVRCVQTVEPLAEKLGLPVETTEDLAASASFLAVVDLLEVVPDGTVLCSHGDVIPDAMSALIRRGLEICGDEDWRKCSTWVLDRGPDGFESAVAWPPPPDHD